MPEEKPLYQLYIGVSPIFGFGERYAILYFWLPARGMNICFGPFLFAAKALVCGIVPFVKLLCKHPMVFACGYTIGFTCCGFWIYLSRFQFFSISSISRTDWREDRDHFFVLHQSAFLTPLVVSTLLRFGFRLFEKRKRGHSAGWKRSYSLPFHRISNLFKTLGSSSMTGPGSADFYSRTKPSWLFIFLQVMTCGCQCGSSFSAGPGPPVMNGIFKVCHGTEPPFLRILPA